MFTEQDTFNALRRSSFNEIFNDIEKILNDESSNDDLRPSLNKNHWNVWEYLKELEIRLYGPLQEDYVLEDHYYAVKEIVNLFPELYKE